MTSSSIFQKSPAPSRCSLSLLHASSLWMDQSGVTRAAPCIRCWVGIGQFPECSTRALAMLATAPGCRYSYSCRGEAQRPHTISLRQQECQPHRDPRDRVWARGWPCLSTFRPFLVTGSSALLSQLSNTGLAKKFLQDFSITPYRNTQMNFAQANISRPDPLFISFGLVFIICYLITIKVCFSFV